MRNLMRLLIKSGGNLQSVLEMLHTTYSDLGNSRTPESELVIAKSLVVPLRKARVAEATKAFARGEGCADFSVDLSLACSQMFP
mmetsp:Transcript_3477/g.8627  ORF Transcript_3477/g.8627 Transcript_3477/m.8627 type:complete len:84 (+) Transcript_3477:1316-1567(+)